LTASARQPAPDGSASGPLSGLPAVAAPVPDVAALYRSMVESNRYLPIPKAEESFVGDGDFRAIGAEFLELFIRHGGLRRHWNVLDVGCGIGRMAIPLTQYLSANARYAGVDVDRHGIAWCRRRISKVYPNFAFQRLDYLNPIYNPTGRLFPHTHPLPFEPGSFDFAIATSVFTHLARWEVKSFLRQLAVILRPGGRLFATFFLLDETASEAMRQGKSRLTFNFPATANVFEAVGLPARSATAYRRSYVEALLAGLGFDLPGGVIRGSWSGAPGGVTYQDVIVAEKPALVPGP